MEKIFRLLEKFFRRICFFPPQQFSWDPSGQALVEFTLCFLLLLVVAWIPADFGLGFYTSQLIGNAAREGARIGSATPGVLVGGVLTLDNTAKSDIATETCRRLPSALLTAPTGGGWTSCGAWSNAGVQVQLVAGTGTCNQMVQVTAAGNYNYFFYQLLRLMRTGTSANDVLISRQASMRWEHQDC
jgi:Flp pilus assembly protein TadG